MMTNSGGISGMLLLAHHDTFTNSAPMRAAANEAVRDQSRWRFGSMNMVNAVGESLDSDNQSLRVNSDCKIRSSWTNLRLLIQGAALFALAERLSTIWLV